MASPVWHDGTAYEAYVGRWSRLVAVEFLRWLDLPAGLRWLDVGSGTGVLTSTVLAAAGPRRVVGVDPSEGFVRQARSAVDDPRADFSVADAQVLPLPRGAVDVVVSGLVLNFVPDPARAAAEFARVVVPGGVVAAYLWDYAEGMAMMRHFWDAASTLDPAAAVRDDGRRFALCRPERLRALWSDAGLTDVSVQALGVPTVFADFADYWTPFLGGQGSAPAYLASLTERQRSALRDLLAARLPAGPDGSIRLTARAWAVCGTSSTTPVPV
ncbi:class I SAM-dependent methyltransferase [Micromonospora mirobrigensis]|uniref:Methyltransferase domain-containing protein n=1 Tax=Micromonospora mirobrigensis TaxID=262898 RepID=A0A1C4Z3N1_9ACTN|nr:class I SAM-dependent methyltransferase [Micromonospora mirobrigensis]SCF27570.1 Methyltransferase domain-containing protein [Micromonospora mirobrigensis]